MDLFSSQATPSPLPHEMRPQSFEDFLFDGLGEVGRLHQAWTEGKRYSFVVYGPPGTGKSTLLELFFKDFDAEKQKINAVDTSVSKIRTLGKEALEHHRLYQKPLLLYIDEAHRLTASQQDALLPYLESGDLLLMAATTENPYYVLGRAFLSRIKKIQIGKLAQKEQAELLKRALDFKGMVLSQELQEGLLRVSYGDNRKLLSDLSYIVDLYTKPDGEWDEDGVRAFFKNERPPLSAQVVRVDAMSALIKSMRASDTKAALTYLAYLLKSGEDPEVLYRRLMVFASEDIGPANSSAAILISSLWTGFSKTGLPEGEYGLYQAVSFLAGSPKSRKVVEYMKWTGQILDGHTEDLQIPNHLKNTGPKGDHSEGNMPLNLSEK